MKYLAMTPVERETLWKDLEAMPPFLAERFSALSAEAAVVPGPGGAFSPVEHCWHLADLEREGYGVRIRRLLSEADPHLPDFDGARDRGKALPDVVAGGGPAGLPGGPGRQTSPCCARSTRDSGSAAARRRRWAPWCSATSRT